MTTATPVGSLSAEALRTITALMDVANLPDCPFEMLQTLRSASPEALALVTTVLDQVQRAATDVPGTHVRISTYTNGLATLQVSDAGSVHMALADYELQLSRDEAIALIDLGQILSNPHVMAALDRAIDPCSQPARLWAGATQ